MRDVSQAHSGLVGTTLNFTLVVELMTVNQFTEKKARSIALIKATNNGEFMIWRPIY